MTEKDRHVETEDQRRTSYDVNPMTSLFEPEYVNVFGVPFTFLPHEGQVNGPPLPPPPKTAIQPVADKAGFEISWPNVIRIDHVYHPHLSLDWQKLKPLELDAGRTAKLAELAPVVEGKPDVTKIGAIDLEKLAKEFRTQRIIFETARDVYDQMQTNWRGSKAFLLVQLVRLVEQFIRSDSINITPALFVHDDLKRRLIVTLNMTKVVQRQSASRTPRSWSRCLIVTIPSAQPATWGRGTPASPANIPRKAMSIFASMTARGRRPKPSISIITPR